jgi:hypothetical protein
MWVVGAAELLQEALRAATFARREHGSQELLRLGAGLGRLVGGASRVEAVKRCGNVDDRRTQPGPLTGSQLCG